MLVGEADATKDLTRVKSPPPPLEYFSFLNQLSLLLTPAPYANIPLPWDTGAWDLKSQPHLCVPKHLSSATPLLSAS